MAGGWLGGEEEGRQVGWPGVARGRRHHQHPSASSWRRLALGARIQDTPRPTPWILQGLFQDSMSFHALVTLNRPLEKR